MKLPRVSQARDRMHTIPASRMREKVQRTALGTGFVLAGAWLVSRAVRQVEHQHPLNLWIFGTGVGLVVLGATIWSSELVLMPLQLVLALVRDVADIVRGKVA